MLMDENKARRCCLEPLISLDPFRTQLYIALRVSLPGGDSGLVWDLIVMLWMR